MIRFGFCLLSVLIFRSCFVLPTRHWSIGRFYLPNSVGFSFDIKLPAIMLGVFAACTVFLLFSRIVRCLLLMFGVFLPFEQVYLFIRLYLFIIHMTVGRGVFIVFRLPCT